jgi:Tol biopolymer transport system component
MIRVRAALVGLAVAVSFGGAMVYGPAPAGAVGSTVQVVGSLIDVRPTITVAGAGSATLASARNETQSFQIVVQAGSSDVDVTDIASGALNGPGDATLPAADISVSRERYYHVTVPSDGELWSTNPCPSDCDIPDALVPKVDPFYHEPREAFPFTVTHGMNQTFWIDVFVPLGQSPGSYKGSLTVAKSDGDVHVDVALTVNAFELPSTSTLRGSFQTNPNKLCPAHNNCTGVTGGSWALYAKYAQAALDDRITISNPGLLSPAAGNLASFRQYAEPLLNGTAPTRLVGAQMTDVTLLRYEADAIGAWKTEGASHGFVSKLTFYCDETAQTEADWIDKCNGPAGDGAGDYLTARDNWDNAVVDPDPGPLPVAKTSNSDAYAWAQQHNPPLVVAGAINTLIPVVNDMHPKGGSSQRATYQSFLDARNRNRLWMYSGCQSSGCGLPFDGQALWTGWPSYHIDQRPLEQRAMPWQAFLYDVSGEYFFDTLIDLSRAWNPCNAAATNCQYNEGANGDGTLFYPGTVAQIGGPPGSDIPIESMRLKRIRDGRQDYEYLHYLSTHGMDADARQVASTLMPSMSQSDGSADQFTAQGQLDSARSQLIADIDQLLGTGDPEIAFTRGAGTAAEIWVMDSDGSHQQRITTNAVSDSQPTWSPDGSKIAFTRGTGTAAEIYVVTLADGTEERLTNNSVEDEKPAWSNDGTAIALVRHAGNGHGQIFVTGAAPGANEVDLSRDPVNDDFDPAWNQSDHITFASVRSTNTGAGSDVYEMAANGTGTPTNLTASPADDDLPAPSPTDAVVAFDSLRNAGQYDLFIMDPDGANPQNLTASTGTHEYDPTWSPDEGTIAYTQGVGVNAEIYALSPSHPVTRTNLTNDPGVSDREPAWQHPCPLCTPDQAPVTDAGTDHTAASGAPFPLDGRGSSDPDGDTLAFRWSQVSGPTVAITSSTAAQATAAGTPGPATLIFRLTTIDPQGLSSTDTVTVTVTASGVPGKPRKPAATAGNERATVTWRPPITDHGSPVTGYVVTTYVAGVAQGAHAYASTATTQIVTGLVQGTTYTFKIAASNANGTGPKSPATNAVTVGTPSAPRSPSAVAGNDRATVSWTRPAKVNGSPLGGYRITVYIGGAAQTTHTYASTATSQVVTGLTQGQSYTFTVAAINANGVGQESVATNAVTPTLSRNRR